MTHCTERLCALALLGLALLLAEAAGVDGAAARPHILWVVADDLGYDVCADLLVCPRVCLQTCSSVCRQTCSPVCLQACSHVCQQVCSPLPGDMLAFVPMSCMGCDCGIGGHWYTEMGGGRQTLCVCARMHIL